MSNFNQDVSSEVVHLTEEEEEDAIMLNASRILRSLEGDDEQTENGSHEVAPGAGHNKEGNIVPRCRGQHQEEEYETITLSSDEEDVDYCRRYDEEVAVVKIRPISKSRVIPSVLDQVVQPESSGQTRATTSTAGSSRQSSSYSQTESFLPSVVGQDLSHLNIDERQGYVKEYISGGLGVIFSMECGLVLFHLSHACLEGDWLGEDYDRWIDDFQPGTHVSFLDSYHSGSEYECLSEERFLRQAVAVWKGERPKHLLRDLKTPDRVADLACHR